MDAFKLQQFLTVAIPNSLKRMIDSTRALTLGDPQAHQGVANLLQCDTKKKMVIFQ
jgi:hypothetical protein